MIIDHLDNAERYHSLHPLFQKAFEFLRSPATAAMPPGRHEIQGDALFAVAAATNSRPHGEEFLEFHRRYIDIHLTFEGEDVIGWRPTPLCSELRQEYDPQSEAGFYDDALMSRTAVPSGVFAIVYPEDAHAPLIGQGFVKKIVMKIAI